MMSERQMSSVHGRVQRQAPLAWHLLIGNGAEFPRSLSRGSNSGMVCGGGVPLHRHP